MVWHQDSEKAQSGPRRAIQLPRKLQLAVAQSQNTCSPGVEVVGLHEAILFALCSLFRLSLLEGIAPSITCGPMFVQQYCLNVSVPVDEESEYPYIPSTIGSLGAITNY